MQISRVFINQPVKGEGAKTSKILYVVYGFHQTVNYLILLYIIMIVLYFSEDFGSWLPNKFGSSYFAKFQSQTLPNLLPHRDHSQTTLTYKGMGDLANFQHYYNSLCNKIVKVERPRKGGRGERRKVF